MEYISDTAALLFGEAQDKVRMPRGTVKSVSSGSCSVLIDGATEETEASLYAGASAGDRVLVAVDGRKAIVIAKRGGEGGGSSPSWDAIIGKPESFPAEHLRGSVELAEGADLNDVLTPGAYRIESNAIAQKVANIPAEIKTALFMVVHKGAFDSCVTQEVASWTNGISARRSWHGTNKTWTDWVYYGGTSSIIASGTSGIWRYAKWSDGTAHLLGKQAWNPTGSQWKGLHIASRTVSLPFKLLEIHSASVSVNAQGSNVVFGTVSKYTANDLTYYHSSVNNIIGGESMLDIWGRWK